MAVRLSGQLGNGALGAFMLGRPPQTGQFTPQTNRARSALSADKAGSVLSAVRAGSTISGDTATGRVE